MSLETEGPCGLCGRRWRLEEVFEVIGELPDPANLVFGRLCPECYVLHYGDKWPS